MLAEIMKTLDIFQLPILINMQIYFSECMCYTIRAHQLCEEKNYGKKYDKTTQQPQNWAELMSNQI